MTQKMSHLQGKTVLISAGGTGGHVYPAIAVAKKLREAGATVFWLGTSEGIESRLVPAAKIQLYTLFVQGIRGNGLKRLLKAPWTIFSAILQAKRVFKKVKPNVFIGFGGFASGPGAVAARLLGVPVVIHEQNAAMGLTNKIVSRWATKILLAFPIENCKGEIVGNPIRETISALPKPEARICENQPFRILVVGGSLGAKALNEIIPEALSPLLIENKIELVHQTGKTTYLETLAIYKEKGTNKHASILEYIEDIDKVYDHTDLVIARAGALTVSEVASVGLPAIFVPLPHSVDNHQFLNAKFLSDNKAAMILEQEKLSVDSLRQSVSQLLDRKTLLHMANQAKSLSHENALPSIINILSEVVYVHDSKH